ncbi:MAG: HAD-IC family P-type ATPase [Lachnospiraceae bacterium]|nr:HAD-IC family P-type ATPase [Lachnospiraceae bacterium]
MTYTGLTQAEVNKRIRDGQVNYTDSGVSKTTKQIIMTHTLTYFNFLNLFLGLIILYTGQIKNMTFMLVIIMNSLVGIVQELRVKKLVDKLAVITATKADVIRDGEKREIPIDEIVLDDVMTVESGTQICADAVVLESTGIEVNESMITGESISVKKNAGDTLYSGSYLVAGSGVAQVIHVGKDNYATQLASKAKDKKRASSEMQNSIKKIIRVTGTILIPVGILLFISQKNIPGTALNDALVSTVAGVISMIPEGLVLLTSISFVVGVGKLAMKRALVQEMEAIEALARVNVLCTDKTGTITTGELEVQEIVPMPGHEESEIRTIMNNIAFAFDDVNSTQTALMNYFDDTKDWSPVIKIPFSSARKYRAISFSGKGAYAVGAPEFLIKGESAVVEKAMSYASDGYRVLLVAAVDPLKEGEDRVTGVKPLALLVISDIIREDAKDTFEYFASQNVAVKVISGDNPAAVSSIAVKAGLQDAERYVDATTLPDDDKELDRIIESYTVFGRVTPDQKERIIKAYQSQGNVVGMVGDGVNDVLALKDADCGVAMAAGSDAAKQVAHIVLLDSDFVCMKDIVKEGRSIISNIERVSALYLTKTIYSVILALIFIVLAKTYPFIPVQNSIVGAFAIGLPSFFLALEQTTDVTSGGFLKHVLRISVPGALTMVTGIMIVQVISAILGFDSGVTTTYNLMVLAFTSLMVLWYVSSPMNKLRRIIVFACIILLSLVIIILPGLLSIESIFVWRSLFMIPLFILEYWEIKALSSLMRKLVK